MTSVSISNNPFSAHHPTQGPRRSCLATPNTNNILPADPRLSTPPRHPQGARHGALTASIVKHSRSQSREAPRAWSCSLISPPFLCPERSLSANLS